MLLKIITSNLLKSKLECLQILFDKLQKVQQAMLAEYQTEYNLQDQVISIC